MVITGQTNQKEANEILNPYYFMNQNHTTLNYIRVISDQLIIILSFYFAHLISHKVFEESTYTIHLFVQMFGWMILSNLTNYYDDFRTEKYFSQFFIIIQNVTVLLVLSSQIFFLFNDREYSRTFLLYYAILLTPFLVIKNYAIKKLINWYHSQGNNILNILFIGDNEISNEIKSKIEKNPQYGLKVTAIVDIIEKNINNLKSKIIEYKKEGLHEIIVTIENIDRHIYLNILDICEAEGIRLKYIPSFYSFRISKDKLSLFANYAIFTHRTEPLQQFLWISIKRGIDIIFSLFFLLFIASWLFPIIFLLIKIDSKGPVFFVQKRWGKDNKVFSCFKFRSMKNDTSFSSPSNFKQATENDPRITKLGNFLRKTSIDELPQFFNILLGDMSVVGPRPHAHEHNLLEKDKIKRYQMRHWVKPGLTGYAQVNGLRGETKTEAEMEKRIEFDIWYIENWTLLLDIQIILLTIYNIIQGKLVGN